MDEFIIGVDFDGTIVKNDYPGIGKLKSGVFFILPLLWMMKFTIILWTCREGELLREATDFCHIHGINLDYVNRNSPKRIETYGGDCRKLSCDLLVDDTAGVVNWYWVFIKALFLRWKKNIRREN